MADKIKSLLIDETLRFAESGTNVAKSGAYLYPVKGIFYLTHHKPLWRPPLSKAWPTASLGLGVTSAMFFFTYLPQAAIMTITSGPLLAPISAAILVLSESSTITNYLARSFLLEDALLDTFDGTLVARGHEGLVAQGRELQRTGGGGSGSGGDPISRLGAMIKRPLGIKITPQMLFRSLLLLPLNFVPVIGSVLYMYVQGKKVGPREHERYFQLKGWDEKKKEEWVVKNRGAYTGLGMASFVLETIPFVSIVFSFTNAVGAALWASDIEKAIQ